MKLFLQTFASNYMKWSVWECFFIFIHCWTCRLRAFNGPALDVVHNIFIHFYMTWWCFIFSILPPIRSVTVLLMYHLEKAVSCILQRVPIPLMSLWSVSALIQMVDLLFPRWRAPFSFWSLKMSDWHVRLIPLKQVRTPHGLSRHLMFWFTLWCFAL